MNKIIKVEVEVSDDDKYCRSSSGKHGYCQYCQSYGWCSLFNKWINQLNVMCERLPECIAAQNKNKKGRG